MKLYVSFGQSHAHRVNGTTFDCNCLCEIECEDEEEGHKIAFDAFDGVFATIYGEERLENALPYFPDGIKKLRQ